MEINTPEIRFKGFSEEWVKLGLGSDIAEIIGGGTPSTLISEFWDGDIDWYSPTEIGHSVYAKGSEKKITALGLKSSSAKVLPAANTILFTSRAGIGDMAILAKQGTTNQGFQSLVVKDGFSTYFIYSAGKQIKEFALKHASGSTFLEISGKQLGRMQLLVPKNKEQDKIGNTFQKLDSLINQHQQKHSKFSKIKKAMLEKMFPKQGETVPEIRCKGFSGEWEESNLLKCTELLTGNPFNSKQFTAEGIFLVRGMNVKRGYLDTSPETSEFWHSSKGLERYMLEPEDIVIQMDGALIGKSYAKINSKNLPAILVQRVTRVRCSEVNPEFIYQYIQKNFLTHISGIKTETAVPHLSLHDIRAFSVFLPERSEQNAIGNYFQKLDALINQHQQQITKLKNIKQACLSKMFV